MKMHPRVIDSRRQAALIPTSDGIVATLGKLDLKGHWIGIQLYPEQDHGQLLSAIEAMGAKLDAVLPYVYDAKAAEPNILAAIDEMAAGKIDAIALTSRGQFSAM